MISRRTVWLPGSSKRWATVFVRLQSVSQTPFPSKSQRTRIPESGPFGSEDVDALSTKRLEVSPDAGSTVNEAARGKGSALKGRVVGDRSTPAIDTVYGISPMPSAAGQTSRRGPPQ